MLLEALVVVLLEPSWGVLGGLLGCLESVLGVLERSWAVSGLSWTLLGTSCPVLALPGFCVKKTRERFQKSRGEPQEISIFCFTGPYKSIHNMTYRGLSVT